jgi:uncharacterized protein (DUF2141 family)
MKSNNIGAPRRRSLRMSWLLSCAGLALGFGAGSASAEEPRSANEIVFKTTVNGASGSVLCAVFTKSGWLDKAVRTGKAKITNRSAVCRFDGIKPGVYAISAFHDENDNGKLDTNLIGIPTEDWCTSRNARGTLGPPSFEDAKFSFRGGLVTLSARMKGTIL